MRKIIIVLIIGLLLITGRSYAQTYITLQNDDYYPFSVYPNCRNSSSTMPAGINIIGWNIATPKTNLIANVTFPPGAYPIWHSLQFVYIPVPGTTYSATVLATSMALSSSFTFFSGSTTLGVWLYKDASGNFSFKFGAP